MVEVQLVPRELRELLDSRERVETQDIQVLLDLTAPMVPSGSKVNRVRVGHRVAREQLV